MIRIAVPGVNGRMGSLIAEHVRNADDLVLAAAMVRGDDLSGADFDVLIDFTLPSGVMDHIDHCVASRCAMVIGATGFSESEFAHLQEAARNIPIVQSYNMSIGVNACYKLLAQAAHLLDPSWQANVFDLHHKHKKDAPSGTSKEMARVIAANSVAPRVIDFSSERRDEVIGEHVVTFYNKSEQIVISHVAHDRAIYAVGALTAARWVFGRKPGLYTMQDVIS